MWLLRGPIVEGRNVIKSGTPLLGVPPHALVVTRYMTLVAGAHARAAFRNEAPVIEVVETLSGRSQHPHLLHGSHGSSSW